MFYLLGGFTDAIDGTVARKTGTVTDFGSKFDTVADFSFTVAVVIKISTAVYFLAWQAKAVAVIALCIFASIAAIAEGMTILGNKQA